MAASSRHSRISGRPSCSPRSRYASGDAAGTLIFASDADHDVLAAVEDVRTLADHLVESDRWTEERATKLVDDISACGPLAPVA